MSILGQTQFIIKSGFLMNENVNKHMARCRCFSPTSVNDLYRVSQKNATSYIFLDYRDNRKPVFIFYTLLESYISQLSTMKKSQWNVIPVGRYPPKHDNPSEVQSRATGTGLFIHKLATRYIFPNCWKTIWLVCIVLTSLKSYICQLTNIEKSKSNNTPEGRYPPKGNTPTKVKLHTRGACVLACNIPIHMAWTMNLKANCHKLRANYIKRYCWAQLNLKKVFLRCNLLAHHVLITVIKEA